MFKRIMIKISINLLTFIYCGVQILYLYGKIAYHLLIRLQLRRNVRILARENNNLRSKFGIIGCKNNTELSGVARFIATSASASCWAFWGFHIYFQIEILSTTHTPDLTGSQKTLHCKT